MEKLWNFFSGDLYEPCRVCKGFYERFLFGPVNPQILILWWGKEKLSIEIFVHVHTSIAMNNYYVALYFISNYGVNQKLISIQHFIVLLVENSQNFYMDPWKIQERDLNLILTDIGYPGHGLYCYHSDNVFIC